jgi:hypothetical protein
MRISEEMLQTAGKVEFHNICNIQNNEKDDLESFMPYCTKLIK